MSSTAIRSRLAVISAWVGLTGAGWLALACAVVAIATGRAVRSGGMTMLGYALALTVVAMWLGSRRRPAITADRADLPRRVSVGRSVDAGFTLHSTRRLAGFTATERCDDSAWQQVRVAVPSLSPAKPFTYRYRFSADRRGHFQVGPLEVEVTDLFGLVRRRHQILGPVEFIVHPQALQVIDRINSREFEDPLVRPPLSRPWPTGSEFYGMREYQPGDDPRRIVWRALARHETYMVREAEYGITDRVVILLDNGVASYPHEQVCPSFELAISAAASVGRSHCSAGFSVCLELNDRQVLAPFRGDHHLVEFLDALADVERDEATLADVLHRLMRRHATNAHHVVVTTNLDTAMTSLLRTFIRGGRSVLLVLVVDDDTDPATLCNVTSLRCPVVEVTVYESVTKSFHHAMGVNRR